MSKTAHIGSTLKTYGTIIALAVIVAMFSILRPDAFFTLSNLINVMRQISLLVVMAIGATLVMSVDEFDLSVGAIASLGGVVAAKMAVAGVPLFFCGMVPILVGLGIGLLNGWIVTQFGVLSFITTLAMGTVLGGVVFWLSDGATIFENIPEGFTSLGAESLFGIPYLILIMLGLLIVFWFLMRHTVFGRHLYAIGGNIRAAAVSGIDIRANKNAAFALCGALAACMGVMLASRLGSAHPTAGDGYFMNAYAAVFLGKTVSKEGVANIWGTFIGAAILGVLANGLTILQVPTYMQDIISGFVIILAVVVQKLSAGDKE